MNTSMRNGPAYWVAALAAIAALAVGAPARAGGVLSAGDYHVCGIQEDLTVVCWGYADAQNSRTAPAAGQYHQVSSGHAFTCGLLTNGQLSCWGQDTAGETSPPDGQYVEIAAGGAHACARKLDNTVKCWGDNSSGRATPLGETFMQLAAGYNHTCGLRANGHIQCWGANDYGQSITKDDKAYKYIAAGRETTCAVDTEGSTACWGRDGRTLGYSDQITTALQGRYSYYCGQFVGHPSLFCTLKTDGTVSCPSLGQPDGKFALLTGGGHIVHQPVQLCGASTGLDNYYSFACGVRADTGEAACWGDNTSGRATPPVGVVFATPPAIPYESLDPRAFYLPCSLDVDNDGQVNALTDGLLILRHLYGHTGDALTGGADATGRGAEGISKCIELLKTTAAGDRD